MFSRCFAVTSIVVFLTPCAWTDTVWLKDGVQLNGDLVNISEGVLSFRTRLAGKVYYPLDAVAGVTTTQFLLVALGDDALLPGRLHHRDDQNFVVLREGGEERPIQLGEIKRIAVVPSTGNENIKPDPTKLSDPLEINVGTGYVSRTGTVDYSGPVAEIEISKETDKGKASVEIDGEYVGESGSFERFFQAKGMVRGGSLGTWAPEVGLDVTRDRNQALDVRANLTFGLRRALWGTETQQIEGSGGVGAGIEQYDPEPLREDQGVSLARVFDGGKLTDEEFFAHLSFRYVRYVFGDSEWEDEVVLRPSLTDFGDLRAVWESSLQIPISERLRLRLEFKLDYDDDPKYRDIDEWRTSLGATFRVKF